MSSISGISSNSFTAALRPRQDDDQRRAAFDQALISAGADQSKLADIHEQIEKAIASASSNAAARPDRKSVENAVNSVLQANGIDVQKFQEALKATRPQHRGHHRHPEQQPAVSTASSSSAPAAGPPYSATGATLDTAG